MAALLLASAAQLTLPVAIRYLIDAGLLAEDAASIDKYFLGLFVVAMAFGLFSAVRFYLVTLLGDRLLAQALLQLLGDLLRHQAGAPGVCSKEYADRAHGRRHHQGGRPLGARQRTLADDA